MKKLNYSSNCVVLFICLTIGLSDAILIGRQRNEEEPGSNVVQHSRFLYPRAHEEVPCKTDHGLLGRCVDIRICYAARRAMIAGNHPIRCGWIDNYVPMVCCHPDQVQHPKLIFRPNRV